MLYSKIEGAGNAKKLVIIHGFLGMSDNWKSMAIKWAEIGFEVHSVDLRNHGRSFHSEDFSYEIMANDLKEYFERSLGIEVKASYGWNFKMIHKTLLRQHPTLDKLAVLLEKVLFLKLVNCRALDLKANLANPFNDRVCCPRCGWHCSEPNQ